jgi:hypothetical protein
MIRLPHCNSFNETAADSEIQGTVQIVALAVAVLFAVQRKFADPSCRQSTLVRTLPAHIPRLDAVKIAVQQKIMRRKDIRTSMCVYVDFVTDEMSIVCLRVAELAFQSDGAQPERESS